MDKFQGHEWHQFPEEVQKTFRRDGYVVLRSFLDAEEVTATYANLERLIKEVVPTLPPEQVFYEEKGDSETLKQIQQLQNNDAYFAQLFFKSKFGRWAQHAIFQQATEHWQSHAAPPRWLLLYDQACRSCYHVAGAGSCG